MTPAAESALDHVTDAPKPETALEFLPAPFRSWFSHRFGAPTLPQRLAWPPLTQGRNLLLCAPTGSGKTLAAFAPLLGHLLDAPSRSERPQLRGLYLAPLKALGTDAGVNLQRHLDEIAQQCPDLPRLWVGVRTGDTPARERRRQLLQPPDVLCTTPESLAILLSQPTATQRFAGLRWVVVDEVHALAGEKRGADLALSLERLADLTPRDPQRIGLSATCTPVEQAARFLVGVDRACTVASVWDRGGLELVIEPCASFRLDTAAPDPHAETPTCALLDRLHTELLRQPATLIFTNVRSLAERLAWALRRRFPQWDDQIAVHHSSLSAQRRRAVEETLKAGRLRAVVTSSSLELGIDVGSVAGVVLIHPPGGVVRLLQRVGRAGHTPDGPRRGLVLTAGPAELLEAVVTAAASRSAQLEPLRPQRAPLDVLCQHLLGMAAARPRNDPERPPWTAEEAFALVKRAACYHDLSRADYYACLDYLSGRRSDGQAWLPARLRWDGDHFSLIDARTARIVRANLGTILAEEPRSIREESSLKSASPRPVIGQLDDAYADRLQPGDRFLLDGRCLEVRRTHDEATGAVLVSEVVGRPLVPSWLGSGWPLSSELAQRLYLLRQRAAEALRDGPLALARLLRRDYHLNGTAVAVLMAYFHRQETVSEIPEACSCLIEMVGGEDGSACYVHTPLNRCGNDAVARVVVGRLARAHNLATESVVADLGFAIVFRGSAELTADEWRIVLNSTEFDADLTAALAESATFREQFQRVATTGMMVLRNPLGGRRRVGGPTWAERRLFDQVRAGDPDFVLLRQALNEVRDLRCDADAARQWLHHLHDRPVRCRRVARVSPFASAWTQVDEGAAEEIDTAEEVLRRLHAALQGHEAASA